MGQDRGVSETRATLMLVATTLFWGLSFPLVKGWLDAAGARDYPGGTEGAGLALIGLRMVLALLILAAFRPRLFRAPGRRALGLGLLLGLINAPGLALQVWGLDRTSPAWSVFLTSLASAWVPLLAFACFRVTVPGLTLFGLALGMAGVVVLGLNEGLEWRFGEGEWLTLASSVVFAAMILLLDRWGKTVPPGHLTAGFLAGSGLPCLLLAAALMERDRGLAAGVKETAALLVEPPVLLGVGLLTFCCTVLAFHWMSTYQPRVAASRAALIYLLEPVWGSAFSVAWGYDTVTGRLLLGGALILGGNFLVELPAWLRERQRGAQGRTEADNAEG